jgi:hypothetical protein
VPTADEYRRLAAERLELASSTSPDFRGTLIALAQGWANLAARLDGGLPDADGDPPG